MHFLNIKKLFSKKIITLLPLSLLLGSPSYAEIVDINDSESLVQTIIDEASKTMGKLVNAKKVSWYWCDTPPAYYPTKNLICLNKNDKGISLAFTTAHEYSHHVQHSLYSLADRAKKNITKVELQADCFAGIILASIPKVTFNPNDAAQMIATVYQYGDQEYDHEDHHGSGENRALALRSGLRFGASKGKFKDAYYKIFCKGDGDK